MPSSEASAAQSHFRDWLRYRLSGCVFAAHFGAQEDRLLFYEHDSSEQIDADVVETFLDEAGAQRRVGVLLCPCIRTATEIAELVGGLARHERWTVSAEPDGARDSGEITLRMTWTTATQDRTNAMGFAPLGHMPVTRRAPYVAIATWTGGRENVSRRRHLEGEVTMGDAPSPVGAEQYRDVFDKTRDRTQRLIADGEVPTEVMRRLAFRLPRAAVETVQHLLAIDPAD